MDFLRPVQLPDMGLSYSEPAAINCKYPILLFCPSVNHKRSVNRTGGCRSLPAVRPTARACPSAIGNSVISPFMVTLPSAAPLVYQTLRSGPTAILVGELPSLGI